MQLRDDEVLVISHLLGELDGLLGGGEVSESAPALPADGSADTDAEVIAFLFRMRARAHTPVPGMCVYAYVVMPEHVHLLVSEPERETLARAMQSLKQSVARTLALRAKDPFWQARYYDFNVWSEKKFVEKVRYIHRNPVARGLVKMPEDWPWSSFRHYLTGAEGTVEIESQWTARRREKMGILPKVRVRSK